ncbi:MAG: DNA/RNA nuclease SfsA [Candidatus Hydrothermarchaeales archaeon]
MIIFSPNDETDPKFGIALRQADKEGVEVYAYSSEFKGDEIVLKRKIKIDLKSA